VNETVPTFFSSPGVEVSESFLIGTYGLDFYLSIRLCDSAGFFNILATINGSCPGNPQLGIGSQFIARVRRDEPFYFPDGFGPITINTADGPADNPLP
jgi:hypothetical protein